MKHTRIWILCLVAGTVALWGSFQTVKDCDDFVGLYAAAKLAGTGQLFNADLIGRVEAPFQAKKEILPFLRLPIYAGALKPLAWFPFGVSRLLWVLLSAAAMILAAGLWPTGNKWHKAFVLCSFPFLYNLVLGQDTALFLLFAVIACRFLERNRDVAAGFLISLCAIKFNLALLFPIVLMTRRRWGAVAGAAGGIAALSGLSCVEGMDWAIREFRSIQLLPTLGGLQAMPNLHGFAWWFPHSSVIEITMGIGVALLVWQVARRCGTISEAMAAALAGGLLTSHHAYLYDCVVLMPILLLALRSVGIQRTLAIVLVSPLPYLLPLGQYGHFWMEAQILIVGFTIMLLFWLLTVRQSEQSAVVMETQEVASLSCSP